MASTSATTRDEIARPFFLFYLEPLVQVTLTHQQMVEYQRLLDAIQIYGVSALPAGKHEGYHNSINLTAPRRHVAMRELPLRDFSGSSLIAGRGDFTIFSLSLIYAFGGVLQRVDIFNDFFDSLNLDSSVIRGIASLSAFSSAVDDAGGVISPELHGLPTMLWPAWCSYASTLVFAGVTQAAAELKATAQTVKLSLQVVKINDPSSWEYAKRRGCSPVLSDLPVFGLYTDSAAVGVKPVVSRGGRLLLAVDTLPSVYALRDLVFPRQMEVVNAE